MDKEHGRKGVCYRLTMCELLRGRRHVKVLERRIRWNNTVCVRDLAEVYYLLVGGASILKYPLQPKSRGSHARASANSTYTRKPWPTQSGT